MSISLSGINSFQVGTGTVSQYSVNTNGAVSLSGYGVNYVNAYNTAGDPSSGYRATSTGRRLETFEKIMNLSRDHLLEDEYNKIMRSARENEGFIAAIG